MKERRIKVNDDYMAKNRPLPTKRKVLMDIITKVGQVVAFGVTGMTIGLGTFLVWMAALSAF